MCKCAFLLHYQKRRHWGVRLHWVSITEKILEFPSFVSPEKLILTTSVISMNKIHANVGGDVK